MPTIKDIAKLAGVSHGTVSNVLNGKANVSVEKIKAVMEAAKQLGYQLSAPARDLRRGGGSGVAIILPSMTSEQYNRLYTGIVCSSDIKITLDLYITNDHAQNEHDILKKLAAKNYQFIIAVSCFSDAEIYYNCLKTPQENIYFIYRHLIGARQFFSVDFNKAAFDIAKMLAKTNAKRIGLFCEQRGYQHIENFIQILQCQLQQSAAYQELVIYDPHQSESYYSAFCFFSGEPFDAIIATDREKAEFLKTASYLGSKASCPVRYILVDDAIYGEEDCYFYRMGYQQLGEYIACCINQSATSDFRLATPKGFFNYAPALVKTAAKLQLLTLESPAIRALEKLLPGFYKQSGIEVNITICSYEEIFAIYSESDKYSNYDILRIDMAYLSWLAPKILKPLSELSSELLALLDNCSSQVQKNYSYFKKIPYTLPFDPSIQLLFYRRDLFEDAMIKRMFYEQTGQQLHVPTTFADFDKIAAFFARGYQAGDHLHPQGTAAVVGNYRLIATEYLLRYYALGGRLLSAEGVLCLDAEIGCEALQQYSLQFSYVQKLSGHWWSELVDLFARGELAMLIVYMNLFNDVAHTAIAPAIGYAPVPGGMPLFGGGGLGVSRYCCKHNEVTQFFTWLFSAEISQQIALLGGNSAHHAIYSNPKIMHSHPWLSLVKESGFKGVRENVLPNGEGINLYNIEYIIGQEIAAYIDKPSTLYETIARINQRITMTQ